MTPLDDLATAVATALHCALHAPATARDAHVAALAALFTQALAQEPTAPAAIAAGLRRALATVLDDPATTGVRLPAVIMLFDAATRQTAQAPIDVAPGPRTSNGLAFGTGSSARLSREVRQRGDESG